MPHVARMVARATELLGERASLIDIGQRLAAVESLPQAAEELGLLDAVDDEYRDEALRALEAIPLSVGRALLAAVVSAASRELPVIMQWKQGAAVELQVWESSEGGSGQLGVLVISPRARDLAAGSTAG